jgi:hypothetical protein
MRRPCRTTSGSVLPTPWKADAFAEDGRRSARHGRGEDENASANGDDDDDDDDDDNDDDDDSRSTAAAE